MMYKRLYRLALLGLTSLSLTLSLTSCARKLTRPSDYLNDCHITYLTVAYAQNKDIVGVAVARENDLLDCNADKAALRAWFDAQKGISK